MVASSNKPEPGVAEALTAAVAETVASQAKEYGTFVATQPIDAGGVRAYNEGDPVPVSNVERHGYERLGWVKRV